MAVIIKTSSLPTGPELTVCESLHGSAEIRAGTVTFIWTSETHGGQGLHARGVVKHVAHIEPRKVRVEVKLSDMAVRVPLNNAKLAPARNLLGEEPLVTLSRKLYRYALNGITEIDPAEVNFLDTHFEQRPTAAAPNKPARARGLGYFIGQARRHIRFWSHSPSMRRWALWRYFSNFREKK